MRREYALKEGGGGEVPPFNENLVFWAPLTEGDLSDHVSGKVPAVDSGCSMLWDASKGMYKFYSNGVWKAACAYSALNMGLGKGGKCTMVIDVEEVSFSGNRYQSMIGSPRWKAGQQTVYICHVRFDSTYSPIKTLHRYCVAYDGNSVIKFYQDGVLKTTINSWALTDFSSNEVTICTIPNNCTNYTMYAKNARIYNKEMTAQEVAQL